MAKIVKLGLPLRFNYPMMALIRELVLAERHRIWMKEYAPFFKKNTTPEEFKSAYKKVIEDNRNPMLKQGLCNLILDETELMEDLIKAAIKGLDFYCDECQRETGIVGSEPDNNKDFIHLPKWRELSCGHIVGIQGKVIGHWDKHGQHFNEKEKG